MCLALALDNVALALAHSMTFGHDDPRIDRRIDRHRIDHIALDYDCENIRDRVYRVPI